MAGNQFLRRFTDHNARAVVLVDAFEATGEVHGVADHRVVKPFCRTHVADDDFAGIQANACAENRTTFGEPFFLEFNEACLTTQRCLRRAQCVVGDVLRSTPECHHGVADVLIDRAVFFANDTAHFA